MSSDFVVPGLLPSNELAVLVANPRTGKTSLCLDLAHAVATGGKFLGRPCSQGSVLYVALDDSADSLASKVSPWAIEAPVTWLFEIPKLSQVLRLNPALIVIDSSSSRWTRLDQVVELRRLAQNCAIILALQSRKGSANQSSPFDSVPGSKAVPAMAHSCWMLLSDPPGCRLIVEHRHGHESLKLHLDPITLTWTSQESLSDAA